MRDINKLSKGFLAVAVCVVLAFAMAAIGKEVKVKLEDCPAAVQKTIKDNAGDGKIIEIEKETGKDGKVTYEAEVKKTNGKVIDIEVAADGTLIDIENEDDEDDEDGDDDKDEDDD